MNASSPNARPLPSSSPVSDPETTFKKIFGGQPRLYRAPGRVNLIGEHTDYNQGFVLPAAIDLYCWTAAAARADRRLQIHSTNLNQSVSVNLDDKPLTRRRDWSDYVVGTAVALEHAGHKLTGADLLVSSEVPLGSGLSSSAALEVSTGYALLEISATKVDPLQLVMACHQAENDFVGAHVGMMDQFISAKGRAGHALMLDCRSFEAKPLLIPPQLRLVVCNTGVKHELTGGEYNQRRAQCEEGVRLLSSALPAIQALRDVGSDQLERNKALLPELIYRRCRHVVTENERVQRAADAFLAGDMGTIGTLMAESHHSMRDDYEISCDELDLMVDIARLQSGVIGARMTGGGFGGCTINLVQADAASEFTLSVAAEYEKHTQIAPAVYILNASEGVHAAAAAKFGA
jgi:galactokinase